LSDGKLRGSAPTTNPLVGPRACPHLFERLDPVRGGDGAEADADVPFDPDRSFPGDIQIYRRLRFGRHVEIFLTDERSYRDDHVIPEGPVDLSVAKFTPNSSLGSRNFVLKSGFDPKESAAMPTMLGTAQRDWLIDGLRSSQATWKIWANEVQLWQMAIDLSQFTTIPEQFRGLFYFGCDQWDGYRRGRRRRSSENPAADRGTATERRAPIRERCVKIA
jgi:hypothetical protein